jgi:hypothetical protein
VVAAGLPPLHAEVAADHRLRLAEKAAVAVGLVAERQADEVIGDLDGDQAPGGKSVPGQAGGPGSGTPRIQV